jgi:hypothetical protein
MTKSLNNQKIAIIQQVLKSENTYLLDQVNDLMNNSSIPNSILPVLTTDDIKGQIEESRQQFEEGNVLSHQEFKKIAKNW